jgi:hypothetical protein
MTLLDREPLTEVLPRTAAGRARAVRFYRFAPGDGYAVDAAMVIEQEGEGAEGYGLTEFPTPWDGRAFEVRKVGAAAPYTVFVGRDGRSCSCHGGTYRPNAPCRHLLAVEAVLANRWLGDVPLQSLPTAAEVDATARQAGLVDGDPFRG